MPVILTQREGGVGSGRAHLGVPSDGTYEDGLLSLTPSTSIADATDAINEVLADLAPAQPGTLANAELVNSATLYTGILPQGLSSNWYQDGKSAGDTLYDVINTSTLTLSSPNPSDIFGPGDEGFLIAKHNEAGAGLNIVARLDIEANFDETVLGPAVQDLTTWDNAGAGDVVADGVVLFSNSKGSLQVTWCGWHNNFNAWQRMNAALNINNLDEGFNSFRLTHNLVAGDKNSKISKVWYDDDTYTLSFSALPTVVENTINSSKYISGVRYYSLTDTFDISYTAENVFRKCYHISQVSNYRFEGKNSSVIKNPTSVPVYTDSFSISETISADRYDYYDIDTRLQVTLNHPWKASVSAQSASENRLYCGYGNVSTDKLEYCLDENYRLPNGAYDTVPTLTGQWNSQATLSGAQALVFNRHIEYPNVDLTSSLPSGNPNYTGFAGDCYYLRGFYDSDPHNNVDLEISGDFINGLSSLGSGDVNLEIKLPSQTGWLDAGKSYNVAVFTGSDGDGCLSSITGDVLNITFGTFSTSLSGGVIVIRVTFRNSNRYISYLSVGW